MPSGLAAEAAQQVLFWEGGERGPSVQGWAWQSSRSTWVPGFCCHRGQNERGCFAYAKCTPRMLRGSIPSRAEPRRPLPPNGETRASGADPGFVDTPSSCSRRIGCMSEDWGGGQGRKETLQERISGPSSRGSCRTRAQLGSATQHGVKWPSGKQRVPLSVQRVHSPPACLLHMQPFEGVAALWKGAVP